MKWDKERLVEIVTEAGKEANFSAIQVSEFGTRVVAGFEVLLEAVRAEAIGWTWAEACSQHDKGLDVRRQNVPELYEKAKLDLNPERDK